LIDIFALAAAQRKAGVSTLVTSEGMRLMIEHRKATDALSMGFRRLPLPRRNRSPAGDNIGGHADE